MNFTKLNKEQFALEYPIIASRLLAKKYKVEESTIRTWAANLQIVKANGRWSKGDERMLLKCYGLPEYPINELAAKLGKTKWGCINKYRELKGLRK